MEILPLAVNTARGYVAFLVGDRTSACTGILGSAEMTGPVRFLAIIPLLAAVLAACQVGPQQPRPAPSVRQIGSDLKCQKGDHGYEDPAGWGFCYPGTWQYTLRSQSNTAPLPELDVIFDITDVPTVNGSPLPSCPSDFPSPVPGATPRCDPHAGEFGVVIVSTYTRNNAPSLAAWVQANMNPAPALPLEPTDWGNAVEAAQLPDGRRIALTPQQVVILTLHPGNLDLEGALSVRLGSWKFTV